MATKQDPGFWNSVGLGQQQLGGQYDEMLRQQQNTANVSGAPMVGAGAEAFGAWLGGLGKGIAKKMTGNLPEGKTVGAVTKQAYEDHKDRFVAQKMGMDPQVYKKKKTLKQALEGYTAKGGTPDEQQMDMLLEVARRANAAGLTDVAAAAMQKHAQKKQAMAELRKMQAEAAKIEGEDDPRARVITPRNPDGSYEEPVTAVVDPKTGRAVSGDRTMGPDEYYLGDQRQYMDRSGGKTEAQQLNKMLTDNYSRTELKGYRQLVVESVKAQKMYGKVMSDLQDAMKSENGATFLSAPGQISSVVDNVARGVNSMFRAVGMTDDLFKVEDDMKLVDKWQVRASNGKLGIEIPLPPGIPRNSAAAQAYQSNIIALAYMEARQEEPSNRGLSDNDIENALKRLSANSANPQVILRNFAEKVMTQQANVDANLSTLRLAGYSQEEVWDAAGLGKLYSDYQNNVRNFREQFGIADVDEYNRVTFDKPVDTDVQPGEPPVPTPGEAAAAGEGGGIETDPELLELLGQ